MGIQEALEEARKDIDARLKAGGDKNMRGPELGVVKWTSASMYKNHPDLRQLGEVVLDAAVALGEEYRTKRGHRVVPKRFTSSVTLFIYPKA